MSLQWECEPNGGHLGEGRGGCDADGRLGMYGGINQINIIRVTGAKLLTTGEGSH